MPDPTRFRLSRRITFAAEGYVTLYSPLGAGDVLNVRQLSLSADANVILTAFFGAATGAVAEATARDDEAAQIFSIEPAANGGAAPDLSCLGAWSPAPGRRIRLYCSAAADVYVQLAGNVEV